jgi:hypothetical protein
MMIGVTVSASWAWAVEVRLFGGTSKLSDYFCRETQRGEIVELFGVGFDDERGTGDWGRQHTKFNRLRATKFRFSATAVQGYKNWLHQARI